MSIQSNINQVLSIASLLATQSPAVKVRAEGKAIQGRQEEAVAGLKDLEKNFIKIESGEKDPYSRTELSNIRSRIGQYNENIQEAKVKELNPQYKKHINIKNEAKQYNLSQTLSGLEESIKRAEENLAIENFRVNNSRKVPESINLITQSAPTGFKWKEKEV